jgi:N-acetylmuramoyl-L-alanine amidase
MSPRPLAIALALLVISPAAQARKDPAEDAYQQARKAYYRLKDDPARRKYRHQWLAAAERFQAVAAKYPKGARAPDALFTSAELLSELSKISMMDEDLRASMAAYTKVFEGYPKSKLADDAALALARIHSDRLGQPDEALRILDTATALGRGDRSGEIALLAKSLEPRKAKAPTPKPVEVQEAPSAALIQAFERAKEPAAAPEIRLPSHGTDAGVTLAEQLGLKVRRVVLDPGHGGHDSGAVGKKGTTEKEVALQLSKKVSELLKAEGLEVILTREEDQFVRLEDRAKAANEARGDLFISLHCNSTAKSSVRGIETYTLNTSSNRYSIRLAARENASSERGISDLQFILADLATKANTEESSRLAERVQASLVRHLSSKYSGVKDLGNKEALFYVLLGVRMPAILVETSFLSNLEDEQRLADPAYQEEMAKAIAAGVQEFLDNRDRIARVD